MSLLSTRFGFACRPWFACLLDGCCLAHSVEEDTYEERKRQIEEHLGPVADDVSFINKGRQVRLPLLHQRDEYTCDSCLSKEDCDWAYDEYNLGGDCLAEK